MPSSPSVSSSSRRARPIASFSRRMRRSIRRTARGYREGRFSIVSDSWTAGRRRAADGRAPRCSWGVPEGGERQLLRYPLREADIKAEKARARVRQGESPDRGGQPCLSVSQSSHRSRDRSHCGYHRLQASAPDSRSRIKAHKGETFRRRRRLTGEEGSTEVAADGATGFSTITRQSGAAQGASGPRETSPARSARSEARGRC